MTTFAPHFTLAEFVRKSDRQPTPAEIEYAGRLSLGAEIIREAVTQELRRLGFDVPASGEPLYVTSWLRSGEDDSQHGNGTAADFRPSRRLSQREIYDAVTHQLRESGLTFGQVIFYPFSDWHIHLGLATGTRRNQVLIANRTETEFFLPTAELVASLPTSRLPIPPRTVTGAVVALAIGAGALTLNALVA